MQNQFVVDVQITEKVIFEEQELLQDGAICSAGFTELEWFVQASYKQVSLISLLIICKVNNFK